MTAVRIRPFHDTDAAATARIYFDAVNVGAQDYYDDAQRRAWAPQVPETAEWLARFKTPTALVAEHGDRVIGFMTLTGDGCIDLAYVAPDRIGEGVAKQLYDAILSAAIERGFAKLTTSASHLARRFFERQGWSVVAEQTVTRTGVKLTNFAMVKSLSSDLSANLSAGSSE